MMLVLIEIGLLLGSLKLRTRFVLCWQLLVAFIGKSNRWLSIFVIV